MPNIIQECVRDQAGWEIVTLTISRPEQLNALNMETIAELETVLDAMAENESVRCVIITGAGEKAFVAGADTRELESLDVDGALKLSADGNRVFRKIQRFSTPVIAAVNGFALGGGCELALACDIRLAAENAVFGLPEVSLGIFPGWGGTQRLPQLVGYGVAAELIFSAGRMDARRAGEIGLVNSVVALGELMNTAMDLAERIAGNAPAAVKAVKKTMQSGQDGTLGDGIRVETREFSALFATKDAQNGLRAFNTRQKYIYEGK